MKEKPGQDTTLGEYLANTTDELGNKYEKMDLLSHQGGLGKGTHRDDRRGELTLGEMISREIGNIIDIDGTMPDEGQDLN